MPLQHKPVAAINEDDLQALIDDKETEGKTIDYKRALPGKKDDDRKEFLYDISSLADAAGGYLVFGMEESKGLPTKLAGLSDIDPDQEITRLEQMARDGIRPPIIALQTVAVRLKTGAVAIVLHVPKSWNPPHQVTYQKSFRFYGRDSNGKYHLDVDELRSIFSLSQGVAERVRLFRIERAAKIASNELPLQLAKGARMVTHLLPLSAFTGNPAVNVHQFGTDPRVLVNIIGGFNINRFNVDGFVAASEEAYVQIFRSGCVEAVQVFPSGHYLEGIPRLPALGFERKVLAHIRGGKQVLRLLTVEPPIVMMLSFLGVKGWRMGLPPGYSSSARDVFDRDPLFISETLLHTFDKTDVVDAKPLLDGAWNAAGWPGSIYYDEQANRNETV